MKRIDFLRTALLGAIAIAAVPSTIFSEVELPKHRNGFSFKVSKELLEDREMFNSFLEKECNGREIAKMDIGWENDDFITKCYTVVVIFK